MDPPKEARVSFVPLSLTLRLRFRFWKDDTPAPPFPLRCSVLRMKEYLYFHQPTARMTRVRTTRATPATTTTVVAAEAGATTTTAVTAATTIAGAATTTAGTITGGTTTVTTGTGAAAGMMTAATEDRGCALKYIRVM